MVRQTAGSFEISLVFCCAARKRTLVDICVHSGRYDNLRFHVIMFWTELLRDGGNGWNFGKSVTFILHDNREFC
jgi:hypothetical protein